MPQITTTSTGQVGKQWRLVPFSWRDRAKFGDCSPPGSSQVTVETIDSSATVWSRFHEAISVRLLERAVACHIATESWVQKLRLFRLRFRLRLYSVARKIVVKLMKPMTYDVKTGVVEVVRQQSFWYTLWAAVIDIQRKKVATVTSKLVFPITQLFIEKPFLQNAKHSNLKATEYRKLL